MVLLFTQGPVKADHAAHLDSVLMRVAATASPKNRQRVRKPAPETRCVDLFLLFRLLLTEYRDEQAQRCD